MIKRRMLSNEEINILKTNSLVLSIKYKREIEYDPMFKLWASLQRKYFLEKSARDIFIEANFPVDILNESLPQVRIKMWTNRLNQFGIEYFLPDCKTYQTTLKYLSNINLKFSKDGFYTNMIRQIRVLLERYYNEQKN